MLQRLALAAALVTTLLLANQFNRSSGYVTLSRLHRRSELLAAIALCAVTVTGLMGILYTTLALGMRKIEITPGQLLLIAPRWLVLALFAAAVALHLTRLVSRGLSYLATLGVLACVATVQEQRGFLMRTEMAGLAQVITTITTPIAVTLTGPVAEPSPANYLASLAFTLAYASALLLLATGLFRRKDLLWVE
jgi:hypothetical protein